MIERLELCEWDVVPPLGAVTLTLTITPPELELAVATRGVSLCPAMMRAIVAAMVVDATAFIVDTTAFEGQTAPPAV